jgi:hypothetical protein
MEIMKNTTAARRREKIQPVRNWSTFVVPNGQVVYRGRYYFAWSRGQFVGAYDTLDDAVESLSLRKLNTHLGLDRPCCPESWTMETP